MIKLKIERTRVYATPPKLRFPKSFWDKVARVAEGSTLENIRMQKQRSGAGLKRNAPSTRERKRKKGRPQLSLVDEKHRFVKGGRRSWTILKYLPDGIGIEIGGATDALRRLVGYAVDRGYVGWLGLSADGVAAVSALIRKEIKAQFRKAQKGGKK
jgi:hypothetical protein